MESNEKRKEQDDLTPEADILPSLEESQRRLKNGRYGFQFGWWVAITAVLVAIAILLTFTLTIGFSKKKYTSLLEDSLPQLVSSDANDIEQDAENLKTLENVWRSFSLYADSMDAQTMLEAAFKAYVEASGDRYAVFYTEEEYRAMSEANSGQYVGIGVTFLQKNLYFGDEKHLVFSVTAITQDSPAATAGICVGDCIFAVTDENGVQKTITELGYDAAIAAIKGEVGTTVDLVIQRPNGDSYAPVFVTCTRAQVEKFPQKGGFSKVTRRLLWFVFRVSI